MICIYTLVRADASKLPKGFSVRQENTSMFSSIHAFLWTITKGKGFYKTFTLHNKEGEAVSFAETINRCFFLRFMPKGAIHIGPCYTPEIHRGNGYYPILLQYIASYYASNECYMIVNDSNLSSIKGIEKAGFERVGTCKKFLNFYF